MRKFSKYVLLSLAAITFFTGMAPEKAVAADDENCLMCHKYQKLGRITGDGARRFYYVAEHEFMQTVHYNVRCRDCHDYIDQIPHSEVKEGVNCAKQCHIKNPATGKYFSHKQIDDVYQESSHGRPKIPSGPEAELQDNKPYCIYCHTNPKYNPAEKEIPKQISDRCVVCHEDDRWVDHWYSHTARRINEVKRSPSEIVELCSSCHGNEKKMADHLETKAYLAGTDSHGEEGGHEEHPEKFTQAAKSYKASFHGAFNKMGWDKPANCLSCHAEAENYYLTVHDIRGAKDPKSTVHLDNRDKTCAKCHKGTDKNKNFSQIDEVHYNPHANSVIEMYVEEFFFWLTSLSFFVLVGAILIDHHRRMWDKIMGKEHVSHKD